MANLLGPAVSVGISKLFGPAVGQLAGGGVSNVVNALMDAAKSVGGSATSGASNPLDSQAKNPQPTQTTQYPERPPIDTATPEVEYPTWEESLARSRALFEPKLESDLLSDSKLARDQNKRLIQALSAKGYDSARGGQRLTGEYNLTQDQNIRRDQLKSDYASLINAYAGQLFSGETNATAQQLSSKLSDRDAKNATLLQQYGIDTTAALQREQNETSRYNYYRDSFLRPILIAMGINPDDMQGVG